MRVIIKRPDEKVGHVCYISDSLKNLQNTVGGYIETHRLTYSPDGKPILMVCNEEGKLLGLKHNFSLPMDEIVGTIFLCSVKGDELTDLPLTFGLAEWKLFLTRLEEGDPE
mgnify:CR=1 FL=1